MYPLEPSSEEMEAMGRTVLAFVREFIDARAAAPASDLDDLAPIVAEARAHAPSDEVVALDEVLGFLGRASAKGFDTAGPGYVGYIPGGGLYTAALADFVACALNRFVNIPAPAPAFVQVEAGVVRWLCDEFGYPPGSQGILTSGGSMANFSAVVAARVAKLPDDFLRGTLYTSDQTHHSVEKAARLAGFPPSSVRVVPSDTELRLDPSALDEAVRSDRAAGRAPFLVVASLGTTNTGAVDPLAAITTVAREHDLWVHADAAYGGFFQLTDRGRALFAGVGEADSIALDPHKGMFLPYGTGCLLVRDGERLRHAHAGAAHYLQDLAASDEVLSSIPTFADYSPELSRDFRGLRVWLPLRLHGVHAFRSALDEKLDLAQRVHQALRGTSPLEVPWAADLSIVAFRARAGDDASRELLRRINASRRIFLSSTVVEGRHTLRVCVLSHRTHRDRVDEAIHLISEAAASL